MRKVIAGIKNPPRCYHFVFNESGDTVTWVLVTNIFAVEWHKFRIGFCSWLQWSPSRIIVTSFRGPERFTISNYIRNWFMRNPIEARGNLVDEFQRIKDDALVQSNKKEL